MKRFVENGDNQTEARWMCKWHILNSVNFMGTSTTVMYVLDLSAEAFWWFIMNKKCWILCNLNSMHSDWIYRKHGSRCSNQKFTNEDCSSKPIKTRKVYFIWSPFLGDREAVQWKDAQSCIHCAWNHNSPRNSFIGNQIRTIYNKVILSPKCFFLMRITKSCRE